MSVFVEKHVDAMIEFVQQASSLGTLFSDTDVPSLLAGYWIVMKKLCFSFCNKNVTPPRRCSSINIK